MATVKYPFDVRVAKLIKKSPLGIGLMEQDGMVIIGEIGEGTTASACAELQVDDRFVSINGTSTLQLNLDDMYQVIIDVPEGEELLIVTSHKNAISDAQMKTIVKEEAKVGHIVNVPDEHKDKSVTEVLESLDVSDPLHREIKTAVYDMTIPLTTRAMREGEIDGVNYHFVTVGDFKRLIDEGKMMEYGEKNGTFYGTLKIDTTHVTPGVNRLSRKKFSKTMKKALVSSDGEATIGHLLGDDAHEDHADMPINHFLKNTPLDHPEHGDTRRKVQAMVYDMTVPYTTRPRREGEVEGREYYFVSKESFAQMAKNDFFLEVGTKNGVYYGTPKLTADMAKQKGHSRRATMKTALASAPAEASISDILEVAGADGGLPADQAASRFLANTDPAHPELGDIRTQIKLAIYDMTVPLTTRAPREGEVNGREYNFVSRDQFELYISKDQMLEYGEKNGVYYGTLKITKEELDQSKRQIKRRQTMKAALATPDAVKQEPFVTVGEHTWSETLV